MDKRKAQIKWMNLTLTINGPVRWAFHWWFQRYHWQHPSFYLLQRYSIRGTGEWRKGQRWTNEWMPFKSPLMGSACFVTNKRAWSIVLKYVCLFWWFFLWTKKDSPRRAFRRRFQNYLRICPSFFRYRDIPCMLSFPQHSTPPWPHSARTNPRDGRFL